MPQFPIIQDTYLPSYFAGSILGQVIVTPIHGLLCQYVRWDAVFYIYGTQILHFLKINHHLKAILFSNVRKVIWILDDKFQEKFY